MKTSFRARIAALVAAGFTVFALLDLIALLGHPAPDGVVQMAATAATKPVR